MIIRTVPPLIAKNLRVLRVLRGATVSRAVPVLGGPSCLCTSMAQPITRAESSSKSIVLTLAVFFNHEEHEGHEEEP
jgi:hypothetical protein